MIKGISRQVIVVRSPDPKLYEQAIFILREDATGITDEMLLQEAARATQKTKKQLPGAVWGMLGAAGTALIWLLTVLL